MQHTWSQVRLLNAPPTREAVLRATASATSLVHFFAKQGGWRSDRMHGMGQGNIQSEMPHAVKDTKGYQLLPSKM